MKLLIYSHFFAPSVGGVETIVSSLAEGLAERKDEQGRCEFDVIVVTQTAAGAESDLGRCFRVIRQPRSGELRKLIQECDLVHIAGPAIGPMMFAWIARKRFLIEHHGFQSICPNGQLLIEPGELPCPGHFMAGSHAECFRCNSARGWLESSKLWLLTFVRRFLCERAAANITPTRWLSQLIRLPNALTVIHGLPPRAVASRPRNAAGPPVIVFQGRLVTTKGARVLLDAAASLIEKKRSFQLLIIGDGPERSALEQQVRSGNLSGHVRFCGRLGPVELESAFLQASIVVIPSLGGEVFGLVVAESMQRGLPVLASDLGAFSEVLGEAGMTFRAGDAAELAVCLDSLLGDAAQRELLGRRAAQRIAEHFARENMIEGHAALYRRLERQ